MPRHLVLQCDNTTAQTKNQFAFSMMAYLVGVEKFASVNAMFLHVGHTHEECLAI